MEDTFQMLQESKVVVRSVPSSNLATMTCPSVKFPSTKISKDLMYGQECQEFTDKIEGKTLCEASDIWFSCQAIMDATCAHAKSGLQVAGLFCYLTAVLCFVASIIGCTA